MSTALPPVPQQQPRLRGCMGKLAIGSLVVLALLCGLSMIAAMLRGPTATPTRAEPVTVAEVQQSETADATQSTTVAVAPQEANVELPQPTAEPPTPVPPTPAPVIGQDLVLGDLRYKVLEAIDSGQTLNSDNQFIESRSTAGRFVRVVFEVENLDKERTPFLGVDLLDDQERECGSFSEGFVYIPTERQCALASLNPNLPQICEYIFEVPATATGLNLKVTDQVPLIGQEALIDLNL